MSLVSAIPASITPARRLRVYLELVRDLRVQRSPQDLLGAYRSRARFVVPFDETVSLSRRGLDDGSLRITRASHWGALIDPWKEQNRLQIVRAGLFRRLMDGSRRVKMDQLHVPPDDRVTDDVAGNNPLLASPLFPAGQETHMGPAVAVAREACTRSEI